MVDATLSASTRSALFALSSMQSQIGVMQSRMATGKRVNTPTDNPNSYFLSAGLSSRASAINELMSGITNTQSAMNAANNGITAIRGLLAAAQTIANQALQSSQAVAVKVSGDNSVPLSSSSVIASTAGSVSRLKAGDHVTVDDGTTTATYTAANGDTLQAFMDAVNDASGLTVTANINAGGQLELTSTANVNISIGSTLGGPGSLHNVLGLYAGTTNFTGNAVRQNLAVQFDSLLTQIDRIAADSGFNGLNFLTGSSSTVALNETGSSSLVVSGSPASSSALGVAASTNQFQFNSDINTAIGNISGALNSLKAIAANVGSMSAIMQARADFNKSMVNTLTTGADALTASD
ncbi:MAG: hypothetical protein WCG92_06360, partial [Hyphomicrobiales bacterium]